MYSFKSLDLKDSFLLKCCNQAFESAYVAYDRQEKLSKEDVKGSNWIIRIKKQTNKSFKIMV